MATPVKPGIALVKFGALDANAEVIGGQNYIGELPAANTALPGVIKRVYLNQTKNNDPVLKVRYEVTEGRYEGFGAWDNVTLNNAAAFKWKPLCAAMGIDVHDLINSTRINPDDESEAGLRVMSIGTLDLSGDKGVPVFFGVEYSKFDGIQRTTVAAVKPRTGSTMFTTIPEPTSVKTDPQKNAENAKGPF